MSEWGIKLRKFFKRSSFDETSGLLSGTVNNNDNPQQQQSSSSPPSSPPQKERMVALDIMRGMTIMLMIIVNNQPATAYYPLDHAEWFGMTPTDCVFPFFLFVMGYAAAIVYSREWPNEIYLYPPLHVKLSIQSYFRELCGGSDKKNEGDLESNENKEEIIKFLYVIPMRKPLYEVVSKWVKLFRRPILMFLIGFSFSVLAHLFNFTHVRVMGVFQRIAICYFIVCLILVWIPWTEIQILVILVLQAVYITITFGLYVPIVDGGAAGEGDNGCGVRGELNDPMCTAEGYIDRLILSRDHIYLQGSYDPEGFLSTLSAVTNAFVGILAFKLARAAGKDAHKRLNYWFIMGSLMILVGLAIDYAGLPIGKKLWTTSFALVSSGIACLFLAIISFIVDIHQFKKYWSAPFLWIGSNPLVMYCVPTLVAIIMLKIPVPYNGKQSNLYSAEFMTLFASWIKPLELASLLHGIVFEMIFIPIAFLLYWKKIYIKL